MPKNIPKDLDPTKDTVDLGDGYNPQENPGIMPKGAQTPAGENETNRQTREVVDNTVPKKDTAAGF